MLPVDDTKGLKAKNELQYLSTFICFTIDK